MNYILASLFIFISSECLYGMDLEKIREISRTNSGDLSVVYALQSEGTSVAFYIPEIWLEFTKHLFDIHHPVATQACIQAELKKAAMAMKALSVVNKKTYLFLKVYIDLTRDIAQWVYECTYHHNISQELIIKDLMPVLCKEAYMCHKESCSEIANFVTSINLAAKDKHWDPVRNRLKKIVEKKHLLYYLKNYYWHGQYKDNSVKKTILTHALDLDAPEDIIVMIAQAGARLSNFCARTPSPLFIVEAKIKELIKEYDRVSLKVLFGDYLLKELHQRLDSLKCIRAALIEFGASKEENFVLLPKQELVVHPHLGRLYDKCFLSWDSCLLFNDNWGI